MLIGPFGFFYLFFSKIDRYFPFLIKIENGQEKKRISLSPLIGFSFRKNAYQKNHNS